MKLEELATRLEKSRDPAHVISVFKNSCGIRDILKYAYRLQGLVSNKQILFGPQLILDRNALGRETTRWSIKPMRQLLWAAAEMQVNAVLLTEFVALERKFETQLISGDVLGARSTLDESVAKYGYSYWYFENLIALLEISQGLQAQKSFVDSLINDSGIADSTKLMLFYMSLRAESTLSPERYQTQLRRDAPYSFEEDDGVGQYVSFHLNFFGQVRFRKPTYALTYADGSSILDRYRALVRVLQVCIADSEMKALRDAAVQSIGFMEDLGSDARIDNLRCYLGRRGERKVPESVRRHLEWLDLYTAGEYSMVSSVILTESSKELSFDALELAARAQARLGKSGEITQTRSIGWFVDRMRHVLLKSSSAGVAAQELLKFVFMFPALSASAQLFAFLMREYRHSSHALPERFGILGDLNGAVLNPKLTLLGGNTPEARRHLALLEKVKKDSITCKYFRARNINDRAGLSALGSFGVPLSRIEKASAEVCVRMNEFEEAEARYRRLQHTGQFLDYQDAVDGLIRVFLRTGQVLMAVREIVSAVLKHPQFQGRVPLDEVIAAVEKGNAEELAGEICVPILFDLYVRALGSSEKDEGRMFAYQEYLLAKGVKKPSELRPQFDQNVKAQLIYFLRYVCVPQVMDSSVAFKGTEELTEERIKVCQMLSELDPEAANVYAEEIKALTQDLMISRGMHEIERSKIYVNVDGVRASVQKECQEIFNRINALASLRKVDERTELVLQTIQKVFEERGQRVTFSLPINERFDAFYQFCATVRNAFVSSNEYGLDVYISVGIRHGTLAGQLRSALERQALITVKGESGKYKDNEHWAEKLRDAGVEDSSIANVLGGLALCSQNIDELIEKIKSNDLQIRTEARVSPGLLDLSLRQSEVRELLRKINRQTTYDEAIDLVIDKLWAITDRALESVKIQLGLYKIVSGRYLDELQKVCNEACTWPQNAELNDAIAKARTSLQEELDRVAYWFTRSSGPQAGEYELQQAIDMALQQIRYIYPKRIFAPSLVVNGTRRLVGRSLSAFVAILFILLDNIVKHSGVDSRSPACSVEVLCGETRTLLRVKSELDETVDSVDLGTRLKALVSEIHGLQASEIVRREGGSGLHKVAKILRIDCECEFKFDATVSNEGFVVSIDMTSGRLFI